MTWSVLALVTAIVPVLKIERVQSGRLFDREGASTHVNACVETLDVRNSLRHLSDISDQTEESNPSAMYVNRRFGEQRHMPDAESR